MFWQPVHGSLALAMFVSAAVSPAFSDAGETTRSVDPEPAQGDRPDFAAGLYDISEYAEVSLDVSRLASQPLYHSTFGYYLATANGRPLGGRVIWPDASIGEPAAFTVDLNQWPKAEALGFFLIPHGATRNQELKGRDPVSFMMRDGRWVAFHDDRPLKGRNASLYATDARLNVDGSRQVLVNAGDGTLRWAERPIAKAKGYSDLKEKVDIIVRKAAAGDNTGTEAPIDDAEGNSVSPPDFVTLPPAGLSAAETGLENADEGESVLYDIHEAESVVLDLQAHASESPFQSSFGFYLTDASGTPFRGRVIWADMTQAESPINLPLSELTLENAEGLGFFIIPDGAVLNPELKNDTPVTFARINGEWAALRFGDWLDGETSMAFFSEARLNADGIGHLKDGQAQGNLNWEDDYLGGDRSYDDVNVDVAITLNADGASPSPPPLLVLDLDEANVDDTLSSDNGGSDTNVAQAQDLNNSSSQSPPLGRIDSTIQPPAEPSYASLFGAPIFSGFGETEASFFLADPQFARQDNEQIQQSFAGSIEYAQDVGEQNEMLLNLFGRYDQIDDQRSFIDVQEAHAAYFGDITTVRAGVLNETWGVLELENIVDIVNQRNIVDDFRADSKLGQPGVKVGVPVLGFGQADVYYLPFPRRRPFPGDDGRFQQVLPIDDDNAFFGSAADNNAERLLQQWAGRVQFLFGDVETAVSHFYGTSRDPLLNVVVDGNGVPVALEPDFELINQSGIEFRALAFGNIFKAEAFRRTADDPFDEGEAFYGFGTGVERDLVRIFGTGLGLTLIGEYYFDNRDVANDEVAPASLDNDVFLAGRLAFNDAADSQLLISGTYDIASQGTVFSTQLQRRFGRSLQMTLKSDLLINVDDDAALTSFQDDYRIQARLRYFF